MPDWLAFADLVGLMVGLACTTTLFAFPLIVVRFGQRPEDFIDALLDGAFAGEVVERIRGR